MSHPRRMSFPAALLRGCLLLLMLWTTVSAQRGVHSITLHANLNDDARIFPAPNAPDPVLRNQSEALGSAFSAAVSWRSRIWRTVRVDLRGEYVSHDKVSSDPVGTPITNGLRVLLLEGSALFALPFSSARFEMYVGGGIGVSTGQRRYAIAAIESQSVSSTPALGMQVILGAEYLIFDALGMRFELLFRDPQMSVENRFPTDTVVANGVRYHLATTPFRSNINLNGNVYSLGIFYCF